MKKILYALSMLFISASCQMTPSTAKLEGNIEDFGNEHIVVNTRMLIPPFQKHQDTLLCKAGVFTYEADLKEYQEVVIHRMNKRLSDNNVKLIWGPKEQLKLNGTMKKYKVEGSKFYDMSNAMEESCQDIKTKLDSLSKIYTVMRKNRPQGEDTKQVFAAIKKESKKLSERFAEFIQQNPTSDFSVFLMQGLSRIDFEACDKILSKEMKEGNFTYFYQRALKKYQMMKAQFEFLDKVQPGKPAPEFTLKNQRGESVSLNQYRGKYVVLDFWGTWCEWCKKDSKDLEKAYKKHHKNVEFISIACRDDYQKWIKAVGNNQKK